ncbi:hypothetical protein ACVWXO_007779 [Bradyrhizobium sp. LM2.7]
MITDLSTSASNCFGQREVRLRIRASQSAINRAGADARASSEAGIVAFRWAHLGPILCSA